MKLVYNESGYKVYKTKILGYPCHVHQTTESGCIVAVPMGKTKADKKMFDDLVYYNKSEYFGNTKKEAVDKVRNFIKNYPRPSIKPS